MPAVVLALLWVLPAGAAAQVTVDFRADHDLAAVLATGIKVREFPAGPRRRHFSLAAQELNILLPGGREIQTTIRRGSISATTEGKLATFELTGPILPANEAFQVASRVHESFGIPAGRLEHWWQTIPGKGRDAPTFSNGQPAHYPQVFFEVRDTANTLYPWSACLELSWNADPDDHRDEAWGLAHHSPPLPGLQRISLDAPSGRVYDRRDAYAELHQLWRQAWLSAGVVSALVLAIMVWLFSRRRQAIR